jgi:hypothetical protein
MYGTKRLDIYSIVDGATLPAWRIAGCSRLTLFKIDQVAEMPAAERAGCETVGNRM